MLWDLSASGVTSPSVECAINTAHPFGPFAAISPDLGTLTVLCDPKVAVWDVASGHPVAEYDMPPFDGVALSPNGKHLLTITNSHGEVRLHPLDHPESSELLPPHGSPVWFVTFSPSGNIMAAVTHQGALWVSDLARKNVCYQADFVTQYLDDNDRLSKVIALDPHFVSDDRLLLLARDRRIVLDLQTGRQTVSSRVGLGPHTAACHSPIASLVAIAFHEPFVELFDYIAGETVRTLHLPGGTQTLAFSPDGSTLAIGVPSGEILLWHVATGQQMLRLRTIPGSVIALRFADDNRALAALVQHRGTKRASLYRWSSE